MKAKGWWAGVSFQLYLRKHAVVIAPYILAVPAIHKPFIWYASSVLGDTSITHR